MWSRRLIAFVCAVLLAGALTAQKPGGGSSGGTGGGTTPRPTTPSPGTNNPANPNTNSRFPSLGSLGSENYVIGKVAMADGGEVPLNVVIQKVCSGRVSPLGYTDHKGNFSVKLSGSSTAGLSDASSDSRPFDNGTFGNAQNSGTNLMGCELRAEYAGFRSESIDIGSKRVMDNPNIGTIVLRRVGGQGGGTTVSATMLSAPKPALKAYEHGMDALRKGKADAAEKEFAKAVELHPKFASAWYELGRLRMTSDQKSAQESFEKAVDADARFVLPYTDLTMLEARRQHWQQAIGWAEKGLKLDSTSFPQLYYFSAVGQYNLKHMDDAEKSAREAIKLDTRHQLPKANQLLGYILVAKGDYSGATEQMRAYLASGPSAADAGVVQAQIAELEAKLTK